MKPMNDQAKDLLLAVVLLTDEVRDWESVGGADLKRDLGEVSVVRHLECIMNMYSLEGDSVLSLTWLNQQDFVVLGCGLLGYGAHCWSKLMKMLSWTCFWVRKMVGMHVLSGGSQAAEDSA